MTAGRARADAFRLTGSAARDGPARGRPEAAEPAPRAERIPAARRRGRAHRSCSCPVCAVRALATGAPARTGRRHRARAVRAPAATEPACPRHLAVQLRLPGPARAGCVLAPLTTREQPGARGQPGVAAAPDHRPGVTPPTLLPGRGRGAAKTDHRHQRCAGRLPGARQPAGTAGRGARGASPTATSRPPGAAAPAGLRPGTPPATSAGCVWGAAR